MQSLESEALLADDQLSSMAFGQFPMSGVWNASTISSIRSTWRNGYGPAEDESAIVSPHGSAENGTATTALSNKLHASSHCSQPFRSWKWPANGTATTALSNKLHASSQCSQPFCSWKWPAYGTTTTALSNKLHASSQCSQPIRTWKWPACNHGGQGEERTWRYNDRCCCTGCSHTTTAHLCRATPAETDHWRTSQPQVLQCAHTTSWQDHRYCCNLILVQLIDTCVM